jgi:hypothetical protein
MNYTAIAAMLLTLAGTVSIALGHPALGAVFSDPNTANSVTAIITAASGLVSAFSAPVHQLLTKAPAAPAPVAPAK